MRKLGQDLVAILLVMPPWIMLAGLLKMLQVNNTWLVYLCVMCMSCLGFVSTRFPWFERWEWPGEEIPRTP